MSDTTDETPDVERTISYRSFLIYALAVLAVFATVVVMIILL